MPHCGSHGVGSNGTKKSDERPTAALSRPVWGLVGGRDRGSELWEDQQHPLEEKGVNPHLPGRPSFEKKFRFSVERTCEGKGSPRAMFPHAPPRQKRGGVGCYPGKPGAPSGKAAAAAGSAGPRRVGGRGRGGGKQRREGWVRSGRTLPRVSLGGRCLPATGLSAFSPLGLFRAGLARCARSPGEFPRRGWLVGWFSACFLFMVLQVALCIRISSKLVTSDLY